MDCPTCAAAGKHLQQTSPRYQHSLSRRCVDRRNLINVRFSRLPPGPAASLDPQAEQPQTSHYHVRISSSIAERTCHRPPHPTAPSDAPGRRNGPGGNEHKSRSDRAARRSAAERIQFAYRLTCLDRMQNARTALRLDTWLNESLSKLSLFASNRRKLISPLSE